MLENEIPGVGLLIQAWERSGMWNCGGAALEGGKSRVGNAREPHWFNWNRCEPELGPREGI